MVRLESSLVRRPHARLPLSGHLLLAEEHRLNAMREAQALAAREGVTLTDADISAWMKMTDALLNFMRIGNPNCAGLPEWPQYTAEKGATMMLNDVCEVVYDPDREARESLK